MTIKRTTAVAFALMALMILMASYSTAADDKAMKVGFVDLERITRDSRYIQGAIDSIEAEAMRYRDRIDRNVGKYQRLGRELEKQKNVLSEKQLESRREDLRNLRSETDDLRYQLNKLLRESQAETLAPALKESMDIVKKIGKEDGYDLILDGQAVLFAAKAIDLSDRVIQELDKRAPAADGAKDEGGKAPALAD